VRRISEKTHGGAAKACVGFLILWLRTLCPSLLLGNCRMGNAVTAGRAALKESRERAAEKAAARLAGRAAAKGAARRGGKPAEAAGCGGGKTGELAETTTGAAGAKTAARAGRAGAKKKPAAAQKRQSAAATQGSASAASPERTPRRCRGPYSPTGAAAALEAHGANSPNKWLNTSHVTLSPNTFLVPRFWLFSLCQGVPLHWQAK
jgi:hypothetical protein